MALLLKTPTPEKASLKAFLSELNEVCVDLIRHRSFAPVPCWRSRFLQVMQEISRACFEKIKLIIAIGVERWIAVQEGLCQTNLCLLMKTSREKGQWIADLFLGSNIYLNFHYF